MDEVKLLPCPHCRSEKVSRTSDVRLFIRCAKCGARGPAIGYVDDHVPNDADWAKAIAAWNTRAIEVTRPTDMEVRDAE